MTTPMTPNKGYDVPTTGTLSGTWGSDINANSFTIIDSNLGGVVTKTLTNADVTLDATESQQLVVRLIGTISGNILITTECIGLTCVENATTGAFNITFDNGVGTPVPCLQGNKTFVITDGTNGPRIWATSSVADLSGTGVIKRASTGQLSTDAGTTNLMFTKDNNGLVLPTGIQGDLVIPFDATIVQAELLADQTGSMVLDLWKAPYSAYPPTVANTIVGANPPTISSGIKSQDATLTGWTKNVTAQDIMRLNINSASAITRFTLALTVTRY